MAANDRQHYALQTIFSFFLGLMVLAFIGVGVNTFYPQPSESNQQAQLAISRKIDALNTQTSNRSLSATEEAEMTRLQNQQNALQDKTDAQTKTWARNTSIILVIFATLVLVVSLVRSEQLKVISNGLLLGGLFTMVYGVGWVIFSGNSVARFWVIAFALLVTIGLGYVKFVYSRGARDAGAAAAASSGAGGEAGGAVPAPGVAGGPAAAAEQARLDELAARVTALEERAAAAAAALGGSEPDRTP